MPKQVDYTLSKEELKQVRKAMKSSRAKEAKRAQVIYSLHLGYSPTEIATSHDVSLATVYNYFNRFKEEGQSGLVNKPIPGRPPKANAAYRERLIEVIETSPQQFNLGFSIWTLPSLQAFMKRDTGVRLSQNRLSEILREEGYVYRRPKKDLGHKQDPKLRQQVAEALEEVKKTPDRDLSDYSIWTKADSA